MKIALLALPGSMMSAISGLADMFWLTNQTIMMNPGIARAPTDKFDTVIVSADGKPVHDAQGKRIDCEASFGDSTVFDRVIVTGMRLNEHKLPIAPDAVQEAAVWLHTQYRQGSQIAGACAGGYVLGDAGLLDGKICTTTWWLFPSFRQRYPNAKALWGKPLVEQDGIITTGGPLSWIDLALHIVKTDAGNALAKLAADMAVADSQPLSQHIYAPRGFVNTIHPLLIRAEQLIRYDAPTMTVEQLAAALTMSTRTLHRKISDLTNETPKAFITRVRIESACVLLENPKNTIVRVAEQCGYHEETVFRRAFQQVMGMSPAQFKKWTLARNAAALSKR